MLQLELKEVTSHVSNVMLLPQVNEMTSNATHAKLSLELYLEFNKLTSDSIPAGHY